MSDKLKRMFKVYWALFLYTGMMVYVIFRSLLGYDVYLYQSEMPIVIGVTILVFYYTARMSIKIKRP